MAKILFIYNDVSGKGNVIKKKSSIKNYFETKGDTFIEYKFINDDELYTMLTNIINSITDIIIAGGDGTINAVINSLMKFDKEARPKVLTLPFGSTNDVATILKITKKYLEEIKLIGTTNYRYKDIYQINDRFFAYAAAIGKFSRLSYDINRKSLKRFGRITYLLNTMRDLVIHYPMKIKVKTKDEEITSDTFLILILSANRVSNFHFRNFAKEPKLNDGTIDIRILRKKFIPGWLKMLVFFFTGGRKTKKDIHINTSSISMDFDVKLPWNTDGEKAMMGNVQISVINEAIEFYCSPKIIDKMF